MSLGIHFTLKKDQHFSIIGVILYVMSIISHFLTFDKSFTQSTALFRCFRMRMRFILLFCFISTCTLYSQVPRAIGEWTDHLPYQHARWVTQSDTKVIFSTDLSVFTIDKEDLSRETISKQDGLSDIGIAQLEFDIYNEQLIIAYDNSNLDLLTEDVVINLPNIQSNQNISGDRSINDIHVMNEESILLALGFGVVEIRSQTADFWFHYQSNSDECYFFSRQHHLRWIR